MAEAVDAPRLVRFGTFEVDLRAGEVRKAGMKVKLTGQPFQVLAVLLERPVRDGMLLRRQNIEPYRVLRLATACRSEPLGRPMVATSLTAPIAAENPRSGCNRSAAAILFRSPRD